MGCGTSKPQSFRAEIPQRSANDERIEKRLAPFLAPSHDLNVNKKYTFMIKILPDQQVGEGYKKTPAYVCLVTPEVFNQKKAEFWGRLTRFPRRGAAPVLGSPEAGRALQRQGSVKKSWPWTPSGRST